MGPQREHESKASAYPLAGYIGDDLPEIVGKEWVVLQENPDGTKVGVPVIYDLDSNGISYHFKGKSPDTVGVWVYPAKTPAGEAIWPYTREGVQGAMDRAYQAVCTHWGVDAPPREMTQRIPLLDEIEQEVTKPDIAAVEVPVTEIKPDYERLGVDTLRMRQKLNERNVDGAIDIMSEIRTYTPIESLNFKNEEVVRFMEVLRDLSVQDLYRQLKRAQEAREAGDLEALDKRLETMQRAIGTAEDAIKQTDIVRAEFQAFQYFKIKIRHFIELLGGRPIPPTE